MLMLENAQRIPDRHDDEWMDLHDRLAGRIRDLLPEAGDHFSTVPGLAFYRRDTFCNPVAVLYEPSLSIVVQGRKRMVLGAETYEYGAGHFTLTSVDLPTIAQVLDGSEDHPFLSMTLKLDLAMVKEVIAEIDLNGIRPDGGGSGIVIASVTADLLDALLRLASLSDVPRDIPILGKMVVREVIYRLLVGPAGARLRQTATLGTQCNRINDVIAWLREHYAEPVSIEMLADMAAMGVSTLHHHFKDITRMSPLQYQKRLRLHEARRIMVTEPIDAGTVAFHVGYESVTQFSREYKRLFGNPPARDVWLIRQR